MWPPSATCFEPLNIMCSKRWANPLRFSGSLAGLAWYQRFTEASGGRWSSARITVSPFFSLYFWWGILGSVGAARAIPASASAATRDLHVRTSLQGPADGHAVGVFQLA